MKKNRSVFILLVLFIFSIRISAQEVKADNIKAADIQKYITFLASDEMKGRNAPSPELDSAASFIANEYRSFGLKPVNGSYFQIVKWGKINLGKDNSLVLYKDGSEIKFKIKDDFVPYTNTANNEFKAKLIFAGYGITANEFNYDSYKDIDVKGKIVVVIGLVPGLKDSKLSGREGYQYYSNEAKINNAIAHGAKGIIILPNPIKRINLQPLASRWPSLMGNNSLDNLPSSIIGDDSKKIPAIEGGEEIIKAIFGSVDKLKEIVNSLDSNNGSKTEISEQECLIKTSTETINTPFKNVVGYLEGADPVLKNELLIVGAHYDHVGVKKNGKPGEDVIFNGADDNASGTSGVLVVAKAFGMLKERPKRSILFMAFGGEEKGLIGSQFYCDNPLFPLSKTIAMLNLDMISRNNPDTVFIVASKRSPDLAAITEKEDEKVGMKLGYSQDKYINQSDHASFLAKNIPAIFFFTAIHKELHTPQDEVALCNFQKAERIAKLVFYDAWFISNDNKHYRILN